MGLYDNVAELDQQLLRKMSDQTERFKLNDGEKDVPVIIVRQPVEPIFCTPAFKKHWLPESADGKAGIIPCAEDAGGVCPICSIRTALLERGMYDQVPSSVKKALDGSVAHEMQLIDIRSHVAVLNELRMAMRSAPDRSNPWGHAPVGAALGRMHMAILTEPVKSWSFSRTVYNLLQSEIFSFQSREGTFRDPSNPAMAAVVWISKTKTGNKQSATYSVRVEWEFAIPMPEALFDVTPDGNVGPASLVKRYDAIHKEAQASIAYWPEHRVLEVLNERGINTDVVGGVDRAIQGMSPQQLPPSSMPGAVVMGSATPIRPRPIIGAPPAAYSSAVQPAISQVEVIVAPPPAYAHGVRTIVAPPPMATTVLPTIGSASKLSCFGKTPSLGDETCKACSQLGECISEAQARITKPTAPAKTELPEPPTAEAAPVQATPQQEAPTTKEAKASSARSSSMVAAAMEKLKKAE